MTERADCFVCRKHRGEEPVPGGPIYEDGLVYASHKAPPLDGRAYLGWCFVEPRRHAPGLADLTDAEAQAIGWLVARLSRALKAELNAEQVYAFVIGDRVPHLHVHLIPRHLDAPREYWGLRVDEWPEAPKGDEAEIAALVARLRTRIQDEGLRKE
ncbi:MAG: HIT family protein [Chloroflexi bacterium]|nr:HIT family protein [Chloroflexota bacterium]